MTAGCHRQPGERLVAADVGEIDGIGGSVAPDLSTWQSDSSSLAIAYSTIANGGTVPVPHLGRQIDDSRGLVQKIQTPAPRRIEIDPAANTDHARRIDTAASRVAVAVVPTNEERMIARYTAETLGL